MEHKQAMRLAELEKEQQDLKKEMYQIIEMMTSLMKERGVVESLNSQEEFVQEKSDNHRVDTVPNRLTLQGMKKGPGESYMEYAVRWKEVAVQVKPSLTNREENSIFVNTLPSPYYDMLVDNVFTEFADLLFSVGRIEDGIRRGIIVGTRASIPKKKGIIFDEHVPTMPMERGNKRKSCMMPDEIVNNLFRTSPHTPVHCNQGPPSQMITQEHDKEINLSYFWSNKRKMIKVYHSLPMTYRELFPILIQNYGISVLPAKPRRPPYPRGYDANAKCEYHGGVIGHSIEDCMALKDKVQALIDANPTKFKKLVN